MTVDHQGNVDHDKVRVYIVRHGQTPWNKLKILQGHKDVPLNEIGQEQARLVGERLKHLDFDEFVSSDLTRCVQTTKQITAPHEHKRAFKLRTTPNLRERSMGPVEGMPLAEAKEKYGAKFKELGETRAELLDRLDAEWDQIINDADTNKHLNVLVCTHGGVITNFSSHLHQHHKYELGAGLSADDLKVPFNTSVTVVEVEKKSKKGQILQFGTVHHLHGHLEKVDQELR
ncbi:hypothetical protein OGAPHI_002550 [Ogataea philodendri]|uniref:Phosphoglycerate mutase n=1 Tax=Ogataea philodendri TaxID=1378263 RepID=A0A9P8T838_9ASCO|nr:uncharacterized protein OGAPHI_002550 [Ogataea philodendri]KAH3668795.1 hypothetical protein OGAPHI_002550 [Ogataea philodendri]